MDFPDVFVLGAGLSKAVSEEMPLVVDLHAYMEAAMGEAISPGIEEWLSLIANREPYLSREENLVNEAKFARASRVIAQYIADCQLAAGQDRPTWFIELVGMWFEWGSTLVTFNYDTLVEELGDPLMVTASTYDAAVQEIGPHKYDRRRPILDKLHGSTVESWDPVNPGEVHQWVPKLSARPKWVESARFEPFIVPPVTTKSSFYEMADVRTRWAVARYAIEKAAAVAIVGYSMPTADFVSSSMIAAGLGAVSPERVQPPAVHVVDRAAPRVVEQLELYNVANPIQEYSGDYAISDYVEELIKASLSKSTQASSRDIRDGDFGDIQIGQVSYSSLRKDVEPRFERSFRDPVLGNARTFGELSNLLEGIDVESVSEYYCAIRFWVDVRGALFLYVKTRDSGA